MQRSCSTIELPRIPKTCWSDCSISCYRQNTTRLNVFCLASYSTVFHASGLYQPICDHTGTLPFCANSRTQSLPLSRFVSSVWLERGQSANPVRSALLGLHLSFRTQSTDLPISPGIWPGRPTLRREPALAIVACIDEPFPAERLEGILLWVCRQTYS